MRRIAMAMGGLWAVPAHAQDISWERLREAVLAHPGLAHEERLVEERRAEIRWAGQAPVLRTELELENFAGTGGASGLGGASLGIWAGGDFRLGAVREREKDLAAAEVSLQAIEPGRRRLELLWTARETWEAWQEACWRADLADSIALDAQAVTQPLEAGRKAGRVGPWEVSLAQAEATQRRLEAQALRRTGQVLWSRLVAWGLPATASHGAGVPVLDSLAAATAPSLDSMGQERERSLLQVQGALQEALDRPVLSGAVGVLRDQARGDVGLGLKVSLPLPPWKRTGLETVRSRREAAALERRIALASRERALRRQGLREELAAESASLREWEERILPQREAAVAQVEAVRNASAVDAAAVWAVRRDAWQARIERLERLVRVRGLQREVRKSEGVEP